MKHKENETYQLVPGDAGDQHWLVRITAGMFNETIIQFGAISINEEAEGVMSFNFFVESSPDSELTSDNEELQEVAGDILQEILRDAVENDTAVFTDKEKDDKA